MTEKELLALLSHDPRRGFEQAIRQYTPYVMKIVRTKLEGVCSYEDIEETVSDIFLMFYKYITQNGNEIGSVKAVLAVISRRRCADVYEQSLKHRDDIPIDELPEIAADDSLENDRARLNDALHKLGQPDEEIFIRKYFFGQNSRSIAEEMGMKTNTVDKRISRGLKRLKTIMEEGN
ncbi:RNA polymerase sigma-70 factor, ECF subfamily [Ruminococcus sp. YE71]|uniref:sigma-70 family RNA polymerase sigma factor n=1 Tax=unclassified Ruminococcus TaxID=2608920 RepID=UPI0008810D24|nr:MULTISPECIES: sigma-70 family RNA polymerase sigma factor [unclassified Ruminococcus]SDA32121.1 RNA polymerase sigma-70 factor, ECF subfamily [Ruminococcus sp. YE78]SFW52957.1 RNA polymerase sigma-70 factor, ECF subfamily [Ruminococcus sp. YE71]